MKNYQYKPSPSVCCHEIQVGLDDDGRLASVRFLGGCPGSLTAVGKLVTGMTPQQAIALLEGTTCGGKPTSCPDQLAQALKAILASNGAVG